MDKEESPIFEKVIPEFYEIVPIFNSGGRLCNYARSEDTGIKVPIEEWERFNQLAGRKHEIIDGIVVYNESLEVCNPDSIDEKTEIEILQEENILLHEQVLSLHDNQTNIELALAEIYERGL